MKPFALALSLAFGSICTPVAADDVDLTVEELIARFEPMGYEVELLVNHAAAAASVGHELLPTQVLFLTNSRLESSLIRREQTVAIDLPVRFLVWKDDAGEVQVETNGVGFLIDRHGLPVFDSKLARLNRALSPYTSGEGLNLLHSDRDVEGTVAALLETLGERGFRIPAVIHFADRAHHRGRALRPTTLVLFGNPAVGTPLMQNARSIGLDLPQKMLIYETADSQVVMAWNDPFFLASKHDVIGEDMRLGNIANALQNIAETAGGLNP